MRGRRTGVAGATLVAGVAIGVLQSEVSRYAVTGLADSVPFILIMLILVGRGTRLVAHVCMLGVTTVGEMNVISPFTVIGGRTLYRLESVREWLSSPLTKSSRIAEVIAV